VGEKFLRKGQQNLEERCKLPQKCIFADLKVQKTRAAAATSFGNKRRIGKNKTRTYKLVTKLQMSVYCRNATFKLLKKPWLLVFWVHLHPVDPPTAYATGSAA